MLYMYSKLLAQLSKKDSWNKKELTKEISRGYRIKKSDLPKIFNDLKKFGVSIEKKKRSIVIKK